MPRGIDPTGLEIATEPSTLTAKLEPSGSRYFKLHVSWAGEGAAEGVITLSLGSEVYQLPVVREP